MIVWASEFPIRNNTRADDLFALFEKWLRNSPHLPFGTIAFPSPPEGESTRIDHDGHSIQLTRVVADDNWWAACQHTWVEDAKREWAIEIVGHGARSSVSVGIRLDCNLLAVGATLPVPRKPYIVKLLLGAFGGGPDSWLTVDDEPVVLAEAAVEDAAAVIKGTTEVRLPVVYVSALPNHRPYVDPQELAEWLAGMAHVVVEPSRHFSFAVARHVNRQNPYAGAVAILWPRAAERQSRMVPHDFESADDLAVECAARVRSALASVRPTTTLTWAYTQELIARRRIEALRAAGSSAVDEYAAAFDAELKGKEARLQDADREIGRLQSEIRRLEAAAGAGDGLRASMNEPEYYPGEIQDAIIYNLSLATANLEKNGRRWHIIQDLLATTKATGIEEEFSDTIKRCFASTGDLTTDARRALEDLGFVLREDGRHFKVLYQNDGRYTFTISRSSSDHRAGKNLASQILRTLFK